MSTINQIIYELLSGIKNVDSTPSKPDNPNFAKSTIPINKNINKPYLNGGNTKMVDSNLEFKSSVTRSRSSVK